MEYENRFGLYVGKQVGEYHILAILPEIYDLIVDCVISDGNVWRFQIGNHYPNLKIEAVDALIDTHIEWIDRKVGYYTERKREIHL